MAVSPLEVAEGFRWILGREPESEYTIEAHTKVSDLRALQIALIRSDEFRQRYIHLRCPSPARDLHLDDLRIVFIHIPKCGGTTVRQILSSHFAPDLVCPERFNRLHDWTMGDLAPFRFFCGHFDYESCRAIPGANTKLVTMLRDPKDRLMSLYFFLKAHRHEVAWAENLELALLARQLAPEAFFCHPSVVGHPYVCNTIVRTFSSPLPQGRWEMTFTDPSDVDPPPSRQNEMVEQAWRVLKDFASFGILEDFDASLRVISHQLGLKLMPVPPQVVLTEVIHSSPRLEPVVPSPVSAELDALLDKPTALDQILYRRAAALFRLRVEELRLAYPDSRAGEPS
jgi:hypothetical protein